MFFQALSDPKYVNGEMFSNNIPKEQDTRDNKDERNSSGSIKYRCMDRGLCPGNIHKLLMQHRQLGLKVRILTTTVERDLSYAFLKSYTQFTVVFGVIKASHSISCRG